MLLENRDVCIHVLADQKINGKVAKLMLKPGLNEISEKDQKIWSRVKDRRPTQEALDPDVGWLVCREEVDLSSMSVAGVKKLVLNTFDLDVLVSFYEQEYDGKNRKTVLEEIEKQRRKISIKR